MGVTWRGLSCIGDSLHTGGWFGRCPLNARDRYEAAMRIHGSYSGDDLSVRGGWYTRRYCDSRLRAE